MGDEEVFVRMDRIARNMTPGRQRDKNRDRQHVRFGHDNGRVQHQEVSRRWRQEVDWKRRGRDEAEVRKHDVRPIHVGEFLRRRRRDIIIDEGKGRGRLERGGKQHQAPTGIAAVRAMRVPPQVGPVRLPRVDRTGVRPVKRFPAHRHNRAHSFGQRIASVDRQKFLVAVQIVALDCRRVSVRCVELRERARWDVLFRDLRGCIGTALEEREGCGEL